MPIITLRQLNKIYCTAAVNNIAVLTDINLTIEPGASVAIMGASGSGKTTLMNILGLLDQPTSGHYFLAGQEVSQLTETACAALRNHAIGFVFQAFYLLPRFTVLQNVGLPLHYRRCPQSEITARALLLLEKLGLAHLARHKPNQLSGGQQQRVAIARALIGNPSVILADEPTGALDSQTSQQIMALFHEVNYTEKVTLIIVTHDQAIADQCHRIVRLQDGILVS